MSYSPEDENWDRAFEAMSAELYPEHKVQAIDEFTTERLKSFYVGNPSVMRPAVETILEAKALLAGTHWSAAVVFYASAVELLMKETLLRPVVFGLVHIPDLAEIVMKEALSQTGFSRYRNLLSALFMLTPIWN